MRIWVVTAKKGEHDKHTEMADHNHDRCGGEQVSILLTCHQVFRHIAIASILVLVKPEPFHQIMKIELSQLLED